MDLKSPPKWPSPTKQIPHFHAVFPLMVVERPGDRGLHFFFGGGRSSWTDSQMSQDVLLKFEKDCLFFFYTW